MSVRLYYSRLKNFIRYGKFRLYIVSDKRRLIYIHVHKVGSTSIKNAFGDEVEGTEFSVQKTVNRKLGKRILTPEQETYKKFSFVRNPFDRLVSCYAYKIKSGTHARITGWYGPFARFNDHETFESFARKVCRVPNIFADPHFLPQYATLYKRGKKLYDYLGKFEHFSEDFAPIQKKFGLLELPHMRKANKGDWRDYYTTPLAKKIYKRYKKDVQTFGYEQAYSDLLAYLKEKGR